MDLSTTRTTELEAVNRMLSAIGEAPVSSLTGISEVVDAVMARSLLHQVSRDVQSDGWHFNTEEDYPLVPESGTGYILVPSNTLEVDTDAEDINTDVVRRGNKLYNKEDHTFVFEETLRTRLILFLEWDDLPEHGRRYITIKAARLFQAKFLGTREFEEFTQDDENQALVNLKRQEARNGNYNIFNNYQVTQRLGVGRLTRLRRW